MKRNRITKLILGLAILFSLGSCVKGEFDTPPVFIPKFEGTANKTIAELKATYLGVLDSIKEDLIIQGIVVGNDESGNIYKKLIIQDATGGIELNLDRTSMYTEFKLGQRVFVKCKGMFLGDYNGLIQLGGKFNGSIGRLPDAMINQHLFRDSLPGTVPTPVKIVVGADNKQYISTLVKLENVSFTEAGQVWATQDVSATNRTLKDQSGKTLVVRTSQYANFAGLKVPSGNGTVYGLLSIFGTTWQLTIRDTSDLVGFVPPPPTYFEESFATSQGGFTTQSVAGTQVWNYDATNKYMKMSGYQSGANNANEDWLISPSIDLSTAPSAVVTFDHTINKGDLANLQTNHTMWVSKNYTSGAPSTATWEKVNIATYPAGNTWTFVNAGKCTLPAGYAGQNNVRVAFKYLSSSAESATWEIRSFKVTKE